MKFIPISDSLKLSEKVGKKSRCQDGTLILDDGKITSVTPYQLIPIMGNRQPESVRKLSPYL